MCTSGIIFGTSTLRLHAKDSHKINQRWPSGTRAHQKENPSITTLF